MTSERMNGVTSVEVLNNDDVSILFTFHLDAGLPATNLQLFAHAAVER